MFELFLSFFAFSMLFLLFVWDFFYSIINVKLVLTKYKPAVQEFGWCEPEGVCARPVWVEMQVFRLYQLLFQAEQIWPSKYEDKRAARLSAALAPAASPCSATAVRVSSACWNIERKSQFWVWASFFSVELSERVGFERFGFQLSQGGDAFSED